MLFLIVIFMHDEVNLKKIAKKGFLLTLLKIFTKQQNVKTNFYPFWSLNSLSIGHARKISINDFYFFASRGKPWVIDLQVRGLVFLALNVYWPPVTYTSRSLEKFIIRLYTHAATWFFFLTKCLKWDILI